MSVFALCFRRQHINMPITVKAKLLIILSTHLYYIIITCFLYHLNVHCISYIPRHGIY